MPRNETREIPFAFRLRLVKGAVPGAEFAVNFSALAVVGQFSAVTAVVGQRRAEALEKVVAGLTDAKTRLDSGECRCELEEVLVVEEQIISERDIAARAYQIYLERGCQSGHEVDDWLQAEYELRQLPVQKLAELPPPKSARGGSKRKTLLDVVHLALTL